MGVQSARDRVEGVIRAGGRNRAADNTCQIGPPLGCEIQLKQFVCSPIDRRAPKHEEEPIRRRKAQAEPWRGSRPGHEITRGAARIEASPPC